MRRTKADLELETRFASDLDGRRRGPAEASEDLHGQIVGWVPDRQFGFINGSDAIDYFFHYSFVISPHDVEDIRIGARVVFNSEKGVKGARAINVELIDLIG